LFDPDESDELSLGPLDFDDLELPPNLPDFTKMSCYLILMSLSCHLTHLILTILNCHLIPDEPELQPTDPER